MRAAILLSHRDASVSHEQRCAKLAHTA